MVTLIILLTVALLVVGCLHVYKTAELHALHVTRAAFENRKHRIEELIKENKDDKLKVKMLTSELKEVELDESIIDDEEKELNSGKFIL